jgi:two-component system sensor histidine kinase KdpD
MDRMRRWSPARVGRVVAVVAASLAAATAATAALESWVGIDNASVVYIVAVAGTAILAGTPGAIATSIGAFVLYDFFFVDPRYTLAIQEPQEWLNVVLLLFVAILVGQLAAAQRRQTETAREREHEARALFRVSRALATRTSAVDAARPVVDGVVAETVATRAWVELSGLDGVERVALDTEPGRPRPSAASVYVLRRTDGDAPAEWTQVHVGARPPSAVGGPGRQAGVLHATARPRDVDGTATADGSGALHKIVMEAGARRVGAVWAVVPRSIGRPGPVDTRLLAAVADQLAQAVEADRLAADARSAAIAREADRVKTALLETVSHDLRTPLAAIRAAAGTLLDRTVELGPEDRYAAAEAIDRDAERLNRIVTNLLDLSRVEGGALRPDLDGYDLEDLVTTALDRARPRLGARTVRVELDGLAPVRVDPTFVDQILDNLFENAARYTGPDAPLAVTASPLDEVTMRLTVEDGGPGVPDDALPRLFDKFYRVSSRGPSARAGSGVGMAVVLGFAEAMGGAVRARRSELGGLAVDLDLPLAVDAGAAA